MLKFSDFFNFHGVPPRTLEISGRQNWANVGNLAHFAQKATKKQQMLKNDDFWPFWGLSIFWKFLTHNTKIAKICLWLRSWPTSKIFWFFENLDKKVFFCGYADCFYHVFTTIASFCQNFVRKFGIFFTLGSSSKAHKGQNSGKQTKFFIFY